MTLDLGCHTAGGIMRNVLAFTPFLLTVAGILGNAGIAHSQAYPSKEVHFVNPGIPGSSPDIWARFIAEKIRPLMGKTIIVENKAGALSNVATEYVARSKPDGYTVLINSGEAMAANMYILKKPPVDVLSALTLVSTTNSGALLIVVPGNSPAKSIADLTALLKAKRDKASYGIANPVSKVVGALYMAHAGLEAVEVQYKSAVDFANDLTSGSLDFAISDAVSTRSHINAGTLRILAISGGNRSQAFPNIPTMVESGYPIDLPGWWGAFVPAETPKPIVEQLNRWFDEALKGDDVRKYFSDRGGDTLSIPFAGTAEFYRKQVAAWGEYVRVAKIQPQ
jgi:tripartite-type tricarboxylate transporter receptor subunit TctC